MGKITRRDGEVFVDLKQFEGHTPGPWRHYDLPNDGSPIRIFRGEDSRFICQMNVIGTRSFEKNSELIDAIPDLLAYARQLEESIERINKIARKWHVAHRENIEHMVQDAANIQTICAGVLQRMRGA